MDPVTVAAIMLIVAGAALAIAIATKWVEF